MIDLAEPPAAPPPRSWPVHLAVVGVSLTAGAAVAVAVLLLVGWRHVPVHRYELSVRLEVAATAEQTAAARTILAKIPSEKGVTVETREQAFEKFLAYLETEDFPAPETVTAADLPETLRLTTTGRDFDCSVAIELRARPGVDNADVIRVHGATGQKSVLGCR